MRPMKWMLSPERRQNARDCHLLRAWSEEVTATPKVIVTLARRPGDEDAAADLLRFSRIQRLYPN
jgi:hypothetical protein